jgi:hypothetical protein
MKNKIIVSEKGTKTAPEVSEAFKTLTTSEGENPIEVRMARENDADENRKTVGIRYFETPVKHEVIQVRLSEVPARQELYRLKVLNTKTNTNQQKT